MISVMVHVFSIPRRSCTMTECRNAVAVSHGMNDAFSTGSQAQYPPQPSTSYDHHMPAMMPSDRNVHGTIVQRRMTFGQSGSSRPASSAPIAKRERHRHAHVPDVKQRRDERP